MKKYIMLIGILATAYAGTQQEYLASLKARKAEVATAVAVANNKHISNLKSILRKAEGEKNEELCKALKEEIAFYEAQNSSAKEVVQSSGGKEGLVGYKWLWIDNPKEFILIDPAGYATFNDTNNKQRKDKADVSDPSTIKLELKDLRWTLKLVDGKYVAEVLESGNPRIYVRSDKFGKVDHNAIYKASKSGEAKQEPAVTVNSVAPEVPASLFGKKM